MGGWSHLTRWWHWCLHSTACLAWGWVGWCCFPFPNFRSRWATGFQNVPIKSHSWDLEAGHFWLLVLTAEHIAHSWLDALVSKSGHGDSRARPAQSAHAQHSRRRHRPQPCCWERASTGLVAKGNIREACHLIVNGSSCQSGKSQNTVKV